MVDIRPFKAIRYTEKAGKLKNLVTQPYDKIDQDMQREYYEKSPYNYCRLILPMEENRYQAVHQHIYEWLSENILSKDFKPSIFICRQQFKINGKDYTRTGIIAALRLYEYSEGMVFPHEITYAAPKADRLNILRTIQKNLEPVFLIYSDPENYTINFFNKVAQNHSLIEVEDSFRVVHKVWQVTDSNEIAFLRNVMENKTLVITDGHHRYESAIVYRNERRNKEEWSEDSAYNFHMSYIVPVQDEGLQIFPTHRLLKKINFSNELLENFKKFFIVSPLKPEVKVIEDFLKENRTNAALCIYDGRAAYGLLIKDKKILSEIIPNNSKNSQVLRFLDVVILREIIFKILMKTGDLILDEDIIYERSTIMAMEKVKLGDAKLAFLVNPMNPELVWEIAQKQERLPEKSTDFYPKPASGLLMMDISSGEKIT